MATIGTLVAVTVDCPDPAALASFYQNALGWELIYSDENTAYLSDGGAIRIGFQKVTDFTPPEWPGQRLPQQLHLDVAVEDLDQAERQCTELGARKADVQPGDQHWRVMLDPAGHPFCLTTSY
jgi:catechol 2,3-dioxygenase-like lactoylglutathione lyase family enzyme